MNQYYAEATFHVLGSKDEYDYVYVTYDKGKLKGIQINKMGSYNILARARIPIDKNDPKISAKYWLSPFGVHDVFMLRF